MKHFTKILLVNFGILLAYAIGIKVWIWAQADPGGEKGLGYMITMMVFIFGHIGLLGLASIISLFFRGSGLFLPLILCAGVMLLIGFSVCFSGALF